MSDIVLSYTHSDKRAAETLGKALNDYGYSVSLDRYPDAGSNWSQQITRDITAAKLVIVLWSTEGLNSKWILREAELADNVTQLMHVRLEAALEVPNALAQNPQLFFTSNGDEPGEFETILTNVTAMIGHPTTDPALQLMIDASSHPLTSGIAPNWASGWGEDEHGVFVEITVNDVTQALRWCPPGQFLMGSPEDEPERSDAEGPQTKITFETGFWLFETPVTQALYSAVTAENPSHFKGSDRPVERVSWNDAHRFIMRINEHFPGLELSLPSESQWEYACRARSTTPFEPNVAREFWGSTVTPKEANFDGNYPYRNGAEGDYRKETVNVKERSFRPNGWGLWQMHGNIYEWCEDTWHQSHEGATLDGLSRQASQQDGETDRVIRGGSWNNGARACRSAFRDGHEPDSRNSYLGFRPARGQSGAPARVAEPPSFGPEEVRERSEGKAPREGRNHPRAAR